jgi:hypothetical protein
MGNTCAVRDRRFLLVSVIVSAVVAAVVGVGASAMANHVFRDVPTNHAFHDEIGSVSEAGIATGFSNGTFGPAQAVTRGQFAAWTSRSAGRVEGISAQTNLTLADHNNTWVTIGYTRITPGAVAPAGRLFGSATGEFYTINPGSCPCYVGVKVVAEVQGGATASEQLDSTLPNQAAVDDGNATRQTVNLPFLFDLADLGWTPGTQVTLSIQVKRWDANVPTITAIVEGWATTAPFDGDAYTSGTSSGTSSGTTSATSSGTTSGPGTSSGTTGSPPGGAGLALPVSSREGGGGPSGLAPVTGLLAGLLVLAGGLFTFSRRWGLSAASA